MHHHPVASPYHPPYLVPGFDYNSHFLFETSKYSVFELGLFDGIGVGDLVGTLVVPLVGVKVGVLDGKWSNVVQYLT